MLNRDMLYKREENNKILIRVGIALMVGLLGLAAGLWLGSTVLDSSGDKISGLQSDLELAGLESQALVEELAAAAQVEETLLAQLSDAEEQASSALQALTQMESDMEVLSSAQEQILTLEKQIQSIQSQVTEEQGSLESLREMSDTVERHRLLLVELRKELPESREESIAYWNTMKTIASRADTALASPADKVILKIDNYFDWNERTPSPTAPVDDYMAWLADYSTSGAIAYEEANVTFTREALLSVIGQMDTVVSRLN
jgi:TolA-binding protein